jgi:Bifunctional DNA primase/polymerase, N-terminal
MTTTAPDAASALLVAALDVAARGWPVFPLVPGGKRPALHGADRCRGTGPCIGPDGHAGWEQRATSDPDRIRAAWTCGPAFNVGLATGRAGLVIIDVDTGCGGEQPPEPWAGLGIRDGAEVLTVLAEQAGQPIPPTRTIATPSGGEHLYFLAPTGDGAPMLRNTAGARGRGLGWKVDTRAHGGYVVAAGSLTPAGRYRVIDDRDPVPLPAWLVERLRPPALPAPPTGSIRTREGRIGRYLHAAITAETARVQQAPTGQRNAYLYVASVALGQLVAGGALAEHEARGALLAAAGPHLAVGAYSPRQADQTITSGLRAGARRPRTITDTPIGDVA